MTLIPWLVTGPFLVFCNWVKLVGDGTNQIKAMTFDEAVNYRQMQSLKQSLHLKKKDILDLYSKSTDE